MIEIRSYRRVFDLERRIYDVDRLRLNPNGVPVRGVVYFLSILAVSAVAATLPLLGVAVRLLPWYLRDIALPGMLATALGAVRVEGRVFHLSALALLRHWAGPRRLAGTARWRARERVWRPQEILLLPDGSDGRMRNLLYTGPGAVKVSVEHERRGRATQQGGVGTARRGRRPVLELRQAADACALVRARVILLGVGARLRVRAHERRGEAQP
jgi:hypothetical protein